LYWNFNPRKLKKGGLGENFSKTNGDPDNCHFVQHIVRWNEAAGI
jgi:hypothetical protein